MLVRPGHRLGDRSRNHPHRAHHRVGSRLGLGRLPLQGAGHTRHRHRLLPVRGPRPHRARSVGRGHGNISLPRKPARRSTTWRTPCEPTCQQCRRERRHLRQEQRRGSYGHCRAPRPLGSFPPRDRGPSAPLIGLEGGRRQLRVRRGRRSTGGPRLRCRSAAVRRGHRGRSTRCDGRTLDRAPCRVRPDRGTRHARSCPENGSGGLLRRPADRHARPRTGGDASERGKWRFHAPLSLPASGQLASVVLQDTAWITTGEGLVFPAPCAANEHFWWGDGYGDLPTEVAYVTSLLLDDLRAVPDFGEQWASAPRGLVALFNEEHPPSVELSRAALLHARLASE